MTTLRRQNVQWVRIYRQTLTLIRKNFLIFYSAPVATLFRALLFPLIATTVLCCLKYVESASFRLSDNGFGDNTFPIRDLSKAMTDIGRLKLVFVANGTSDALFDPVVDGIKGLKGMDKMEVVKTSAVDGIFDECRQSLAGRSPCYATVVFGQYDDAIAEYTIAADEYTFYSQKWGDWRAGNDGVDNFIFPLQWAINAQISNLDDTLRPSTRVWNLSPRTSRGAVDTNEPIKDESPIWWVQIVSMFVGPFFVLALIGVVYHEATFVATERETSMSELLGSQEVTIVPRIASTMLSFAALYLPGFLFSSIIMTQILFVKTSDILLLVLTLLAGLSFVSFSHFLGSFFSKANLAGLYSSTLVFALALSTLGATMKYYEPIPMITSMSLLFPPFTWATLIEDIALRESARRGFGLVKLHREISSNGDELSKVQFLTGSFYFVFFIVQIFVFICLTYLVERYLWAVKRQYDRIEASSDVAVRCTGLTKTYPGKRRWYWPFSATTGPVVAVDNLNLEVKKGSVTFLLGPNGGGKTTTLKCIAGMTSMDSGSRLELNEDGVVFGICPQHNVFWSGLTVRQHIDIWTKLKTAAQPVVIDDDIITECDLLEKIDAPAGTLSGGQMRKLQLAISFCGGSKVCCIDEASSGLDPLSRRSIWNIIQKGHSKRTILVTTHFLDEADVLADHIVVVYKGKLVCEGAGTTLKARYGDSYLIRNDKLEADEEENDSMVWRTKTSADATRKLLELEALDNDNTYNVVFPTLEQVFLKVTSDTAVHGTGGDGFVGEMETADVIEEKIFAMEDEQANDINLDVGSGIGFVKQVRALFHKRYMLLYSKTGWIGYAINLIAPIIIAAAFAKFLRDFKSLNTCQDGLVEFRHPKSGLYDTISTPWWPALEPWRSRGDFYVYDDTILAVLGPATSWPDEAYLASVDGYVNAYGDSDGYSSSQITNETVLREKALTALRKVSEINAVSITLAEAQGYFDGFGLWAPDSEPAVIFHKHTNNWRFEASSMTVMNILTNKMANSTTGSGRRISTFLGTLRHPVVNENAFSLPISALISLAFIVSASIAIMYPAYEKVNNVRALQYCNGVTPTALWVAYLLFDMQFIVVEAIIVWAIMYAGGVARLYYASSYLLGVFILFGIATYLGTYLFSLFVKKAAFAVAVGVHILLFVLYLISYVVVGAIGDTDLRFDKYSALQYGLGLSSPAANLLRALFIASNSYGVLCGRWADNDISNPMDYILYGGVYTNLCVQIIFLITTLTAYEYGSADFVRRITNRAVPSRLHYRVETDGSQTVPAVVTTEAEKTTGITTATTAWEVLRVASISKYFGKSFAVENVSFSIKSNETLALLGGNGAGKTTTINMIRGELVPNFGDIFLDGTSVLKNPAKARLQMGVCPQDDAVDNLTVHQTLRFYATVKGLKNVEGNVDKVLSALNITVYSNLAVKALSGGTKRKLSVAIALLGNPRLLLLDEPSTGQDAGAKRILWKALKNISANRAILLTTHSMEEASALATNVAIMGGRMLATGSLSSLQSRYGGAYMVRAVRDPTVSSHEAERAVKDLFEGQVKDYNDSHGQVCFGLPHNKSALGSIMRVMEELKGEKLEKDVVDETQVGGSAAGAGGSSAAQMEKGTMRYFSDYTINEPTLEEVFMNVARESGVAGDV